MNNFPFCPIFKAGAQGLARVSIYKSVTLKLIISVHCSLVFL